MKTLQERVDSFAQKKPRPVERGGPSYAATLNWAHRELEQARAEYAALTVEDQTARLTRDKIDFVLRRYHDYCIRQNMGAHYRERGLRPDDKTEFEHVIPAALIRDLYLWGRITVTEALNAPTCRLRAVNHKLLNAQGRSSTTPDIYWFWHRYRNLGIEIETYKGQLIDTTKWNLDHHYQLFL